jgi:antibiotic biosynthesis monooxygenase (ABM) superfamily enzyme
MTRTPLTGPYSDAYLREITDDPVTVAVARVAKDGCEDELRTMLEEMAHVVQHAKGSLGAALFEPGEDGGEYHLVARFRNAVVLRTWEESDERLEILARMAPYVEEVNVAATHSPDAFFAAMAGTSSRSVHHRWGLDLLWVLPASLVVSVLLSPYTTGLNIVLRVLVGSAAVSLVYALALGPVRGLVKRRRNKKAPLR